ncbi:MAG: hypothetical protein ACTSU4_11905 [Promethearchaeota archaeon]
MSVEEEIDIRELFFDIIDIVKFELNFYTAKNSPMFERIVKTRVFQTKLQKLKDFIMKYFDIIYKDKESPINRAALEAQLNNIAYITNYYNDLSNFYKDQTEIIITKEKILNLIEYSHIEKLFLIFTNILDWEHYRASLLFPTDKKKEKILKEFLNKLASSEIKNIDDLIDIEQSIDDFIKQLEIE